MPEAVITSEFGSMIVSEPVLLNRRKSNNVSCIVQSEHLFLSIIDGLPNFEGFNKTGSDTTIEPNSDERTASDLRHLKVGGYKQKNQSDNKREECSFFVL